MKNNNSILYIIKSQAGCTLTRDEIQGAACRPPDDMHRTSRDDSIPSPTVLDKQKDELRFVFLFWWTITYRKRAMCFRGSHITQ